MIYYILGYYKLVRINMISTQYNDFKYENLGNGIEICISNEHRFGTDAFLLADFASPRHKDSVCDLCSGSGIIALLMIRNFKPAYVSAVEIQQKAAEQIRLARGIEGLCKFEVFEADLKEWKSESELDLITCNPPYKINNTGIKNKQDAVTIARHEILCDINDVCECAARNLKFGGRLCICNRPERLCDTMDAMRKNGVEPKRLRMVQKMPTSPPWLFLIEGKKGSKPYMDIEAPLYTTDGNGNYSDEMKRIYRLQD